MTHQIQYGVKEVGALDSLILWLRSKEVAERNAREYGHIVMARDVGEPYEVKTLPTTPGSVITYTAVKGNEVIAALLEDGKWHATVITLIPDHLGNDWTLLFDAGETS